MSRGNRVLLTTKMVKAMTEGQELWDSEEKGLHVRALASSKVYRFQYTSPVGLKGKKRKTFGAIPLEAARAKARKWREMINDGIDPWDDEEQETLPPTLREAKERFDLEVKKSEDVWREVQNNGGFYEKKEVETRVPFSFMKPLTIIGYKRDMESIIKEFGPGKILTSFTMKDLDGFHSKRSVKVVRPKLGGDGGGGVAARKSLNFLHTLLKACVRWGLIEKADLLQLTAIFENIQTQRPRKKKRILREEEIPQFFDALDRLKSDFTKNGKKKGARRLKEDLLRVDFVEILLATWSRKSEFMTARLSWIDWSGPVKHMVLRDTKGHGTRRVPLGRDAVLILKKLTDKWHQNGRKEEEDFVLPSPRKKGAAFKNPMKGWKVFIKDAGLEPGITPHTIRHTMITMGVRKSGITRENAAAVVGHSNLPTTDGYIHEVDTTTVETINKTAETIKSMRVKKEYDEDDVVPEYIKQEREQVKRLHEATVTSAH